MRQKMPTITETTAELPQRLTQAKDVKQRQRWQALYVVVRGPARSRQELAALWGVHRQSVVAWLTAYAAGGVAQLLGRPEGCFKRPQDYVSVGMSRG